MTNDYTEIRNIEIRNKTQTQLSMPIDTNSLNPSPSSSSNSIKDSLTNEINTEKDIIYINTSEPDKHFFLPLSYELCDYICEKNRLSFDKIKSNVDHVHFDMLNTEPCKTQTIASDGNCYFRTVAYIISGNVDNHALFREKITNHIKTSNSKFNCFMPDTYKNGEDYIRRTKMNTLSVWATLVEIIATCDLFDIHIMTYHRSNNTWRPHFFGSRNLHKPTLYIEHVRSVHFVPVLCIQRNNVCLIGHDNADINSTDQTYSKKDIDQWRNICQHSMNNNNAKNPSLFYNYAFEGYPNNISICKTSTAIGDGNCFYRTLSRSIFGREHFYSEFRKSIVHYLKFNTDEEDFSLLIPDKNYKQYVEINKHENDKIWATDTEILVASAFLNCNIVIYDSSQRSDLQWPVFCFNKFGTFDATLKTMFIHMTNNNHYEPILCIKEQNKCINKCNQNNQMPSQSINRTIKEKTATTVAETLPDDVKNDINNWKIKCQQAMNGSNPKYPSHCFDYAFKGFPKNISVCKKGTARGDGNCFYRTLSRLIFGHEQFFGEFRKNVINYLKFDPDGKGFDFVEGKTVQDYVKENEHEKNAIWATENEILVASAFLNCNIVIYNPSQRVDLRWPVFCFNKFGTYDVSLKTIFIYADKDHYEPILCIKEKNKCFNKCNQTKNIEPSNKISCESIGKLFVSNSAEVVEISKKSQLNDTANTEPENPNIRRSTRIKNLTTGKAFANIDDSALRVDNRYRTQKDRERNKRKYETDPISKEDKLNTKKSKYENDHVSRQNQIDYQRNRYENDPEYRESHRENQMKYQSNRYENDPEYRESHRENQMEYQSNRYENDPEYRESHKEYYKDKYKNNKQHRNYYKNLAKLQRERKKNNQKTKTFEEIRDIFNAEISNNTPEYTCSCCKRLFFLNQVMPCSIEKYEVAKCPQAGEIAKTCIFNVSDTEDECNNDDTYATKLVCQTCNDKILRGKMPEQAEINNLKLKEIPKELNCLNDLEAQLIAKNIAFMTMQGIQLYKQNYHHVKGPVICVPADLHNTMTNLPSSNCKEHLIFIKLKRKLSFKTHVGFRPVSTFKIKNALHYLKQNNIWYKDVEFNENWTESNLWDDIEFSDDEEDKPTKNDENDDGENETSEKIYDTCLMPIDIGQEILDFKRVEDILCLAPCEGKKPVPLLNNIENEAISFPTLFPDGKGTFYDQREIRITLFKYLQLMIMNSNNRFARHPTYLFFALFIYEVQQVLSTVSIAMRQGNKALPANQITKDMLQSSEKLKEILKSDQGYTFLKPIRGTPAYWESTKKDVFAMLRQLGKCTFFLTLSSAESRWPEIPKTIMKQNNDNRQFEKLTKNDLNAILRSNPVTVARMFDHRVQVFLNKLFNNSDYIGRVLDYFYRVEFQTRGSAHIHCIIWIENAPKYEIDSNETVTEFIDKYITCALPDKDEEPELHEIVKNVQTHSYNHSSSCPKKNKKCRFGFPRPPCKKTIITNAPENRNEAEIEEAKKFIKKLIDLINCKECNYNSIDDILNVIGGNYEYYERALSLITTKSEIILKRDVNEVWINQYNKKALLMWNGNLDLQYVKDDYQCVAYVLSYLAKAERQMSKLLKATADESKKGNLSAKSAMHKMGSKYLCNREVSSQEASYKVCGLPLKKCSRNTQVICTGENVTRITLPLKQLQNQCSEENDAIDKDQIWMPNIEDKYVNRPQTNEMNELCLATFVSEYRILSKAEAQKKSINIVQLNNNFGAIMKRTRTKPAIIRYAKFSKETKPEEHYQSILQLFLPYYEKCELKPEQFDTYETYYHNGEIIINNRVIKVKELVDRNQSIYDKMGKKIDENLEKIVNDNNIVEDAWAEMFPAVELERNENALPLEPTETDEIDVPDLAENDTNINVALEKRGWLYNEDEIKPLLKQLNNEQKDIVYFARQWCLDKANGKNPKPFHIHLTGGGGTGKSLVVKIICYIAESILGTMENLRPDDITVAMTAPTGVAAFNIRGKTNHNAFLLPIHLSKGYQSLRNETIANLRKELSNLQILIIDEISMVNKLIFFYIQRRLQQIKQDNTAPFGNVSILAVGDFYQLPPVLGHPVYSEYSDIPDFWMKYFKVFELTEIMRQKDDALFASFLNRLRIKRKNDPLCDEDQNMLLQLTENKISNSNCLHIFATNTEVDDHNEMKLNELETELITVTAQDSVNKQKCRKPQKNMFEQLPDTLRLKIGARVMLIKNINTEDGLVNGVFGTLTSINIETGEDFPSTIYVEFDNENIGKRLRNEKGIKGKSTPISASEEKSNKNMSGSRKQYALKLAWASTVHKVQGVTVSEAVVSMEKMKFAGQSYVALSRVTSANGLQIKNCKPENIFCDAKISNVLLSMKKLKSNTSQLSFDIILHNTQNLNVHFDKLVCDNRMLNTNFICLTETWLKNSNTANLQIKGFEFIHKRRCDSYKTKKFTALQNSSGGGVACYNKIENKVTMLDLLINDLEYISFEISQNKTIIVLIYRPSQYHIGDFKQKMKQLLQKLIQFSNKNILIIGDFNSDAKNTENRFVEFMKKYNYEQYVLEATTEKDTIIDHVYAKLLSDCIYRLEIEIIPIYYSYHEAVGIRFKKIEIKNQEEQRKRKREEEGRRTIKKKRNQ